MDAELYYYEEEPLEDKLIDYAGARWPKEAYVMIERRVRRYPVPESYSLLTPLYDDRQLVANPIEGL